MCIDDDKEILVVDDCQDNLFLIELVFEVEGCSIRKACNGNDGICKVNQAHPDLIILDLMMPDISGLEFMKHLEDNGLSHIPILLLTANAYVRKEDALLANDICHKPFDIDNLLLKVKSLLSCSSSCQENIPTTLAADFQSEMFSSKDRSF